MKIYLANWTEHSCEEQVAGFTSRKAAKEWIAKMTRESIVFHGGEDKTHSVIQEWDTSQTKSRNFMTLHG